jgi:hypothetical protein
MEPSTARVAMVIEVCFMVSQCSHWEDRWNNSPSENDLAACLDVVNVARPEKGLCELAQAGVSAPGEHLKTRVDALYSVLIEMLRYTGVFSAIEVYTARRVSYCV